MRHFQAQFIHQSGRSCPLQRVHALTDHLRPHSKYIAFHGGGFLQVAVSEAPSQSACELELLRAGAPDTALRLAGTDQHSKSALPSSKLSAPARNQNPHPSGSKSVQSLKATCLPNIPSSNTSPIFEP